MDVWCHGRGEKFNNEPLSREQLVAGSSAVNDSMVCWDERELGGQTWALSKILKWLEQYP